MSIGVLGAGAFGTSLAVALARDGHDVSLYARDAAKARAIAAAGAVAALPGVALPPKVTLADTVPPFPDILLLAVPTQTLRGVLEMQRPHLQGRSLVACCKGVELGTGLLPNEVLREAAPGAVPVLLSGPGFAVDIAAGLPTALTLAAQDADKAEALQETLSTSVLRIYRSTDMTGVALGGALKNVIAIACGMAIGAGLGESARAALMTRGYAEIQRLARVRGARIETLAGLSGLGDLVLTCTSEKSRNYSFGLQLGATGHADAIATTEGIATARAVAALATGEGLDLPITAAIAAVLDGNRTVTEAAEALLARPLRPE